MTIQIARHTVIPVGIMDVRVLTATGVTTMATGLCHIVGDITRAVS